jgi:predicted RNA binding protein YcfA (HicA-like mRNA interferase family)
MAGEMRFSEVRKMLEAKGYQLGRINGSHHIFKKAGTRSLPIPVHHGKVHPSYVRMIKKLEA